jgi:hypothetical protein
MRLLNTDTFEFKEVYDDSIPAYAILSHRWRDDEVSYQDLLACRRRDSAGFSKIMKACELVASDSANNGGVYGSWIWIDTCCINKESSTEISEAINSMWRWYENAAVCYAYLDDVVPNRSVEESELFTRGWTLQELLAPHKVEFYSRTWTRLGNKVELCDHISTATGINQRIILSENPFEIHRCSAAQKLSWAAHRRTSRAEDMAYCLLGLLDVNMPLLYGEGTKAFVRLQEKLMRSYDDESILAWPVATGRDEEFTLSGTLKGAYLTSLFADTPAKFAHCGNIVQRGFFGEREPSQIANRGLRMDAVLIPISGRQHEFLAPLKCGISSSHKHYPEAPLALHLTLVSREQSLYHRIGCVNLARPELSILKSPVPWRRPWNTGELGQSPLIPKRLRFRVSLSSRSVLYFAWPLAACLLLRMPWYWCTCIIAASVTFIMSSRHYLAVLKRKSIYVSKYAGVSVRISEIEEASSKNLVGDDMSYY